MKKYLLWISVAGLLISCKSPKKKARTSQPVVTKVNENNTKASLEHDQFGIKTDGLKTENKVIKPHQTLSNILGDLGCDANQIYKAAQKSKGVTNIRSIRPGQHYRAYLKDDSLSYLVWQPNAMKYVVFDWSNDSLNVYKAYHPMRLKEELASGKIKYSLSRALSRQDASPLLANKLQNIFAWKVNFLGLQKGDSFKALYNKKFVGNTYFGVGKIKAAELTNSGETHRAYYFTEGKLDGYFDGSGESVQSALKRTPFSFHPRISSRFSRRRFNPVLKRWMPHYGVDYAAPIGTPVLAGGDGKIIEADYRGPNGNIVEIRHNATYRTAYLHMNRFARNIHPGTFVKQGEVIGYVGTTGRSTGPHLHYAIYKNNHPVNPLQVDMPSAASIPDSMMDAFKKEKNTLDDQLQEDSAQKYISSSNQPVTLTSPQ